MQRVPTPTSDVCDPVCDGHRLECSVLLQTQALWGAAAPKRTIVCYGADKQKWAQVMGALRKGDKSDGHVTMIVERRLKRSKDIDADAEVKEANIDY